MRNFLQQLQPRDRKALAGLGAFLGVLILYWGLLQPSWTYYSEGKQTLNANRDLLQWMEANASRVTPGAGPTANRSLLQTLTETAGDFGIRISRYQPQDQTKVRVWLTEANYLDALQWLATLQQNHQVVIESVIIDSTQKSGLVNIQCTLS